MSRAKEIKDGRILFQPTDKPKAILEDCCKDCFFNVSCSGPKSAGGDVFADIDVKPPYGDVEIARMANCLYGK